MEINKEIIQRYHLGLCSPKEVAAVKAWLDSDQVNLTFLEEEELQQLEATGWEELTARFDLQSADQGPEPVSISRTRLFSFHWQIAASIVFILGLSVYFLFNSNRKNHSQAQNSTLVAYKDIHTRRGEKLQVTLPDGTQIWMNSESTLRFPVQFTHNQRRVSFNGEAYFNVAKNPDKPFIITSKRTRIQVLGTRFNLRDYPAEPLSAVVVEEGKIRFSGSGSPENLVLSANQKGTYTESVTPALTAQNVYNTSKYMDWKDNKLVLDNLTLQEIVPILERWYGIKVLIGNPKLNQQRYTGTFKNPTVRQVIESISFALKSKYQQQQNTWTISE